MSSEFISLGDFARALGLSRTTISRWIDVGILEPHHVLPSGRRVFTQEQLDKFIKKIDSKDGVAGGEEPCQFHKA